MAVSLSAIMLFFACLWGLGFSLGRLVRESESFLERNLMRLGVGLSAFIVLGIALNALRVPLDWRVFLLASVACPAYCFVFRKGYRQLKAPFLRIKLSGISVFAVLAIFAAVLFMYVSGSFVYPYLEDDDPWTHARGVKYVSVEKTAFANEFLNSQYIDPYPPSYDMIFGVLHQVSSSIYWTIKFFNALLISLSIVFFYFFARLFTGSRGKALFATFVLASVPAYLSHFIWAPALAMVVFFPAMYALEMAAKDKKWWIIAAVCFASILLSHPTQAAKLFAFIAIYIGIKSLSLFLSNRKAWLKDSWPWFAAVAGGVVLSLFWWALKWRVFARFATGGFKGGSEAAAAVVQNSPNFIARFFTLVVRALNPDGGTATRVYTLKDLAFAQGSNMINNPVGLGFFVFLLMLAGLFSALAGFARFLPRPRVFVSAVVVIVMISTIALTSRTLEFQEGFYGRDGPLRPQNWVNPPSYQGVFAITLVLALLVAAFVLSLVALVRAGNEQRGRLVFLAILLGWLLFAFLGVNNKTFNLPIGLFAFRFWMILAVPAAILASEGLFAVLGFVGKLRLEPLAATILKLAIASVVVVGVFFTSSVQKYEVNTSNWPPGAFWSVAYDAQGRVVAHEVEDFMWLRALPVNTKVFTFSQPDQVIGFDMYSCGWCDEEAGMRNRFAGSGNVSAQELHGFLLDKGYEYFIIGSIDAKNYGLNVTNRMVSDIAASGLFEVAYQGKLAFVFKAS